ncbi:DUF2164 domain-containing protein [Patescibacteria group bacterium]|nr:DUF2164 domain-containing protein [Patescibacteria group bacterium]MBU1890476.1 DUF2164 domain-containing protein [Patescibacteria group bacterium]
MAVKRKWDLISEEEKQECIKELIGFFSTERDEEIGIIAAGNILDHFMKNIGIKLYNKGVDDSILFRKERFESLGIDMEAILKK